MCKYGGFNCTKFLLNSTQALETVLACDMRNVL